MDSRMQRGFWLGNMKVESGLQDLSVDGRVILKWILKHWDGSEWIGFIWIIIAINGGTFVNTVMKFVVP
jgi:hypothetical protein